MPQATDQHAEPIRIVAAIDFSQSSLRALQWAESIASGRAASVVAVHAIDPTPLAHIADAADTLVARAEERVAAVCEPLRMKGIPCEAHCTVGRPWQAVREVVEQQGADLVIAGNRGLSPVKRALLGSNADRMLRTVSAPVLVVHASDLPRGHLRVLVATDFSPDANETIALFRRLFVRSMIRLEVRVLHATVQPELVESVDVPLIERVDWTRIEADAADAVERVAREFRAEGIETSVSVVRGGAARSILAESRSWHADVIVVGRRGMSGFERLIMGSTAERVLHAAGCAVFTAQLAAAPARRVQPAYIS